MSDNRRSAKAASLVRGELARLLLEEVSDPSMMGVVINDVQLSADLRKAKVYFSSKYPSKELLKGLARVSPFLRRKLGESLTLRYVPELSFVEDSHTENLVHVLDLIESLNIKPAPASAEATLEQHV